jgi:peroxisomal membrane protein 4
MNIINHLLLEKKYHTILSIIKGFRNGAVYGAKIRFPHALVMTFLFQNGSLESKLRWILKATYFHSRNLACFVFIYKTLMALQKHIRGKEDKQDPFVAGFIGGYIIFGENNNINNQIVLYLFSRILVGFAKLLVKKQVIPEPPHTFPIFAALVWGCVMWLFRYHRETLQPSLQSSMQYLYNDSEIWTSWKNWLWHNK